MIQRPERLHTLTWEALAEPNVRNPVRLLALITQIEFIFNPWHPLTIGSLPNTGFFYYSLTLFFCCKMFWRCFPYERTRKWVIKFDWKIYFLPVSGCSQPVFQLPANQPANAGLWVQPDLAHLVDRHRDDHHGSRNSCMERGMEYILYQWYLRQLMTEMHM